MEDIEADGECFRLCLVLNIHDEISWECLGDHCHVMAMCVWLSVGNSTSGFGEQLAVSSEGYCVNICARVYLNGKGFATLLVIICNVVWKEVCLLDAASVMRLPSLWQGQDLIIEK